MKIAIPALAGLLLLAACESAGGSAAVRDLPPTLMSDSRVIAVRVSDRPTQGIGEDFRTRFAAVVQTR